MKDQWIVALDMGTSSVRAMLFDLRGRAVPDMEVQLAYAQRTTADGGVETDAEVLFQRTLQCLKQLLEKVPQTSAAQIAGVGISCFWHSLMGTDRDGCALTPLYSWADTRAASHVAELSALWSREQYHGLTGCELHPCFWPAKLLWLQAADSESFDRVARWISFGEYIMWRFFGETQCSVSMASGTGCYDQIRNAWATDVLEHLPITEHNLSPVVDRKKMSQGLKPEFAAQLPALKDVPWAQPIGDGACSNVGCGAIDPARIAINVGTSGAIRIVVPAPKTQILPGLFCYRVDSDNCLIGGAFANGGNVYAWEHANLALDARPVNARRMGTMKPNSHGLTVLPFWAGERSPGWHLNARAVVAGMNLHTTPMDIARASLESIAYCFDIARAQLQANFPEAREIVASGGALVHDPTWVQIMADVFGVPVTTSRVFEASARGAALLAAESIGLVPALAKLPSYLGRTFKPNDTHRDAYQQGRADFLALYHRFYPDILES